MSSRKNKRQPYKVRPNRNAMCPCGSGRSYKNCCAGKAKAAGAAQPQKRRVSGLMIGVVAAVLIVLTLAVFRPWDSGDEVADPRPWEYDVMSDQYWHPGHGHWHDGRPPIETGTPAPSQAMQPRPWEYDAVRDMHWNPEHGHWHDGPPPVEQGPGPSTQIPSVQTQPEPWEYDPENDRYWHFDHWHDGPPPPEHLR